MLVVVGVAASCGSIDLPRGVENVASTSPTPRVFVGGPDVEVVAEERVVDGTGVAPPQPEPLPDSGAWTVSARGSVVNVWSRPGGGSVRFAVEAHNPWDQSIDFPVLTGQQAPDGSVWYAVLLGIQPNGSRGWVSADDVTLQRSDDRIVVDLSDRILRHFHEGRLRHRFVIGIGKPSTPTTPGRFFVWAKLQPSDGTGPYGSYLLGISGFSEVLTNWPGGGRMAVHGTADPNDRGGEVSFGCIRVFNRQMNRLRDVPMGTMVVIRR
jgi:hypothetical protein